MPTLTHLQHIEAGSIQVLAIGRRKLIVADASGGKRPMGGMVEGASTADLAVIRVEARDGLPPQARSLACLASLLRIRHVVLAVDNLDRVDHSPDVFARIEAEYSGLARRLGLGNVVTIPVSSAPWYHGPSLMAHVQAVPVGDDASRNASQAADDAVEKADQFEATIVWMGNAAMLPGRAYIMKIGARTATATVTPLKYRINVDTLEHVAAAKLEPNDIGVCQLELDQPVSFAPYASSRELGGFSLLDPLSHETVGAGMIHFALRRAQNVHWQAVDIDKAARAAIKGQKPCVLWFTGISASGKSTIANLVEKKLHAMGRHTYLLDGDNVRHGLNKDLGFTEAARVENIRRVAEVAALMADAGLIVITAFISPFRSERRMARRLLPAEQFLEVFIDAPLEVAEARDPKGLYKKARRGELTNFTGIDSPYEGPEHAEIRIDSAATSPERAAEFIVEEMGRRGL
jgi:bifunctional enzyme CysN/CysC